MGTRTMKLLSLLCQFATAKECCEFLKLSALQVYDRKYDGTYRYIKVTGNRYNSDGYYLQAHANGELNTNGYSIIGYDGKFKFTRNPDRISRKAVYANMNGDSTCLEDIDKDLARKSAVFDTECLDEKKEEEKEEEEPVEEEEEEPVEPDCILDVNDGWTNTPGCAKRKCAAWKVVDAWSLTKGRKNGFAIEIQVPKVGLGVGWSVAVRFPKKPERGTFQTWNANIWNVYEKDGELVFIMHQPWWWTDKENKESIIFVADHMFDQEQAKVHLYTGRQKSHACFSDTNTSRSSIRSLREDDDVDKTTSTSRGSDSTSLDTMDQMTAEITKVIIRNGEISKFNFREL